jgi:hypothetical protein
LINHVALTGTLCYLRLFGTAHYAAAAIVLEFDCVLNSNPCAPSTTYGTITLDQVGIGISVTVDLAGSDQKFRDFTLSYGGSATTITDNDPNNSVSLMPGSFQINPYNGVIDLGGSGGKGWTGLDLYSTLLTGDSPLLLADFFGASGGLYAALHIQNIGSATGGNCEGMCPGHHRTGLPEDRSEYR